MYIDTAGWLVPDRADDPPVIRVPTSRTTPLDVTEPLGVVWHFTGDPPRDEVANVVGPDGSIAYGRPGYAAALARRWRSLPPPPPPGEKQRRASAHAIIARSTGKIFQLAPFAVGTWHCKTRGKIGGRDDMRINGCTIGIELENAGRLKARNGRWLCYPYNDPNREVPDTTIGRAADGTYWQRYSVDQERTIARIIRAVRRRYPSVAKDDLTRTHAEYDPERRSDPGPLAIEVLAQIVAPLG